MKLNAEKLREIKSRIEKARLLISSPLLDDAELMYNIIIDIRQNAHYCEDSEGFCSGVAAQLGTNCTPGRGIDECDED